MPMPAASASKTLAAVVSSSGSGSGALRLLVLCSELISPGAAVPFTVSEELKRAAVQCLLAIAGGEAALGEDGVVAAAAARPELSASSPVALGHSLWALLALAKGERDRALRTDAMRAIAALCIAIRCPETLCCFLPGVSSGLDSQERMIDDAKPVRCNDQHRSLQGCSKVNDACLI